MCLIGLISGRISERVYLGYLRTKEVLKGDVNQIPKVNRERINRKIEIENFSNKFRLIDRTEAGYGISGTIPGLSPFHLLKIIQPSENIINYVEFRWQKEDSKRIGVYCPEYIRRLLGSLL